MVKFPRRKRASDLDGGRLRAGQEAWTHEAERRTHSNKQRDKLLAIVSAGLSIRSSPGGTAMLLRVTRF
jgi:DNA invertase Pin-like site-specific DNA recombinase